MIAVYSICDICKYISSNEISNCQFIAIDETIVSLQISRKYLRVLTCTLLRQRIIIYQIEMEAIDDASSVYGK